MSDKNLAHQEGRLGRYQLLSRLTTGGMAEVWLARATGIKGFQKTVVIKTILPHLANDPEFLDMFINEALLAAALNHPNIVQIFDLGQIDNRYYIAMEFIVGRTMRQVYRLLRKQHKVMPPWLVLKVTLSVCEALEYAHNRLDDEGNYLGLVHRDVTPENVMISFSGITKVVDFGIAKATTGAMVTQPGKIKGKMSYLAPEQIIGQTDVDRRTDIYALGVVLYETLTGARPFRAPNDMGLLLKITKESPTPPSDIARWIPSPLNDIVMKAMAKNPADRYQTARELGDDIESFMSSANMRGSERHVSEYMCKLFDKEERRAIAELGISTHSTSPKSVDVSSSMELQGPDSRGYSMVGGALEEQLRQSAEMSGVKGIEPGRDSSPSGSYSGVSVGPPSQSSPPPPPEPKEVEQQDEVVDIDLSGFEGAVKVFKTSEVEAEQIEEVSADLEVSQAFDKLKDDDLEDEEVYPAEDDLLDDEESGEYEEPEKADDSLSVSLEASQNVPAPKERPQSPRFIVPSPKNIQGRKSKGKAAPPAQAPAPAPPKAPVRPKTSAQPKAPASATAPPKAPTSAPAPPKAPVRPKTSAPPKAPVRPKTSAPPKAPVRPKTSAPPKAPVRPKTSAPPKAPASAPAPPKAPATATAPPKAPSMAELDLEAFEMPNLAAPEVPGPETPSVEVPESPNAKVSKPEVPKPKVSKPKPETPKPKTPKPETPKPKAPKSSGLDLEAFEMPTLTAPDGPAGPEIPSIAAPEASKAPSVDEPKSSGLDFGSLEIPSLDMSDVVGLEEPNTEKEASSSLNIPDVSVGLDIDAHSSAALPPTPGIFDSPSKTPGAAARSAWDKVVQRRAEAEESDEGEPEAFWEDSENLTREIELVPSAKHAWGLLVQKAESVAKKEEESDGKQVDRPSAEERAQPTRSSHVWDTFTRAQVGEGEDDASHSVPERETAQSRPSSHMWDVFIQNKEQRGEGSASDPRQEPRTRKKSEEKNEGWWKAVHVDPRAEAAERFEEGLSLVRQGRREEALKAWEKAVQLAPDDRRYQGNLRLLQKAMEKK